jgi:hypothetical protein
MKTIILSMTCGSADEACGGCAQPFAVWKEPDQ